MKTITLWQPWASLLACGAKEYETRSWETSYRGPIAIHAAKKKPPQQEDLEWDSFNAMTNALTKQYGACRFDWHLGGTRMNADGSDNGFDIPLGSVIAVANLVDCLRVEKVSDTVALLTNEYTGSLSYKAIAIRKSSREYAFGDYAPGRYAWKLEDVHSLAEPIPAKGYQRLWNWDETPHLVAIDPWVIGTTKIWTPRGVYSGKRIEPGEEDTIVGLEVRI